MNFSSDNMCEHIPFVISHNTFSFTYINDYDLHTAFRNIKSNVCGVDGIPLKFFKKDFLLLSNYILHLFNSVITISVFPENVTPIVIPIHKGGASLNTENLRSVSILPILSKVLEHVISQISHHIAQFHSLNDRQTGYCRDCCA